MAKKKNGKVKRRSTARLTEKQKCQILMLIKAGKPQRYVAQKVGCAQGSVSRIVNS